MTGMPFKWSLTWRWCGRVASRRDDWCTSARRTTPRYASMAEDGRAVHPHALLLPMSETGVRQKVAPDHLRSIVYRGYSMRYSFGVAVLALVLLAGCASGPPRVQPPVPTEAKAKGASAVRSTVLDNTDHMVVHLDDAREVLYVQSFGNSVAVGALFGPLGVMANIAATKAATEVDQAKLKGKIPVSASQTFRDAAKEAGLPLEPKRTEGGVNFSPYLHVVKLSDGNVLLASALVVEAPTPGALFPQARYFYQLPLRYTVDDLSLSKPATVAEIGKQLQTGFVELIRFYQGDKSEAMGAEKMVRFKSDFLSPRFDFEQGGKIAAENAERVWIRNIFGVAAVLRANVTIVGPWE